MALPINETLVHNYEKQIYYSKSVVYKDKTLNKVDRHTAELAISTLETVAADLILHLGHPKHFAKNEILRDVRQSIYLTEALQLTSDISTTSLDKLKAALVDLTIDSEFNPETILTKVTGYIKAISDSL